MNFERTLNYAKDQDEKNPLKNFRNEFLFPKHNGNHVLYFCGNSLGLQPKNTSVYIQQELNDWATFGVEGHFMAKNPWYSYHELLTNTSAKIVGALPSEVVVMNQLTSNLHLMMVSFYRPTAKRFKIICEASAFPSDQYALQSQAHFHGYDRAQAIIEVKPRSGEYTIRTEDILKTINDHSDDLALVMFSGVNYLSGQVFDMKAITEAGHKAGAYVGFDLAHAAGNIELKLHDWKVDFACWCSYKYLNSGPGSVGGVFVHQKHESNFDLPRFAGWWGHDKEKRFLMAPTFSPMKGAEGWQISNAPVLSMAAYKASSELFEKAGIENIVQQSKKLTTYLEFIIESINKKISNDKQLQIITPSDARGCQLSIIAHGYGKSLHKSLTEKGIICDWREPNIIRIAPAPLYNSFEDIYLLGEALETLVVSG